MSPDAQPHEPARPRSLRRLGWTIAAAALMAGTAVAALGISSREQTYARLQQTAMERSVPIVAVASPATLNNKVTLDLPGRLEAFSRAALFARVTGYVASWKADIGAAVKAGDVLAEIEAPDLDQQLLQAQSDLANAQSAAQLSELTNQRYQALLPNNTVSRQSADEKATDAASKRALVKSAQANVARLTALAQFKRVVAPFDGVVTARNTDVGALINAGSAAGTELFVISDTARLRLYVNVPQSYVPAVKSGTVARITVPERPGKTYAARVASGSGVVDTASGTMRTQLVVENTEGELIPGAYANVHLDIAPDGVVLSVPASAVIFDKGGVRVATVDAAGIVAFRKIAISRDLGNSVEISAGLRQEDLVIQNPPDDLLDGDQVAIKQRLPDRTPPSAGVGKTSNKS
jgi:multidrug efflux system membrane fusion protein